MFEFLLVLAVVNTVLVFAYDYACRLRQSEFFACQYIETVKMIAEDQSFPGEIVGFLLAAGLRLDDRKFMRMVGRLFIGQLKLPGGEQDGARAIIKALKALNRGQREKLSTAINALVAAASYRDLRYGRRIRVALLSTDKSARIANESTELANALSLCGALPLAA
ncbi:MAG: hypothetical protein WCF85_13420 [Rhodospirillaceae bacterium]